MAATGHIRRENLRARLIEAAEARIRSSGLSGLRARDVTADAHCALGALYTAFADLDDLILRVNSVTMARLGNSLSATAAGGVGPRARLKALALAYYCFARDNRALWAALFEHRMAGGASVPEWQLAEQAVLIRQLVAPLSGYLPGLTEADLLVRARTLFSAVHGIVAISFEGRFLGLAPTDLENELSAFVDVIATGIEATARE